MDLCVCGEGWAPGLIILPSVTTLNDFLLHFSLLFICTIEDKWLSLACEDWH